MRVHRNRRRRHRHGRRGSRREQENTGSRCGRESYWDAARRYMDRAVERREGCSRKRVVRADIEWHIILCNAFSCYITVISIASAHFNHSPRRSIHPPIPSARLLSLWRISLPIHLLPRRALAPLILRDIIHDRRDMLSAPPPRLLLYTHHFRISLCAGWNSKADGEEK